MENSTEKGGWGTAISIAIIVIILALGGYYFYSSKLAKINYDNTQITAGASQSDEISDIANDLNNIQIDNLTPDTSSL
jgi:hypothetical protein